MQNYSLLEVNIDVFLFLTVSVKIILRVLKLEQVAILGVGNINFTLPFFNYTRQIFVDFTDYFAMF